MTIPFPDEPAEFDRCWSSAVGELSALSSVLAQVETRAGAAFVRKRDDAANALRDLQTWLTRQKEEQVVKVQALIDENRRRAYQLRKMVGG